MGFFAEQTIKRHKAVTNARCRLGHQQEPVGGCRSSGISAKLVSQAAEVIRRVPPSVKRRYRPSPKAGPIAFCCVPPDSSALMPPIWSASRPREGKSERLTCLSGFHRSERISALPQWK